VTRNIVNLIEDANLPAPVYRTARRLLDMAHPDNGYVRVTYDELQAICGTSSPDTARAHLVKLAKMGLITYRRNAAVHVHWHDWQYIADGMVIAQRSRRATSDQKVSMSDHVELTDAEPVIAQRSKSTTERSRRATSDQFDRSAITPRLTRLTNTGRQEEGYPSCLPEGGAGETAPETAELARSQALLTDPDVAIDPRTAEHLAAQYSFADILRHVCRYRRDLDTGSVRSPMVIARRLRDGFPATITDDDRASPLYRRHISEDEIAAEEHARRVNKYLPEEYRGIILGYPDESEE
jgi:hypothetical protein